MTENMRKFLETVSRSEELCAKANGAGKDELTAMAKELGIELTEADFEQPAGELSDDELDAVAGGGACACVAGGGGTEKKKDGKCACFFTGVGFDYTYDDVRCTCVGAGGGTSEN